MYIALLMLLPIAIGLFEMIFLKGRIGWREFIAMELAVLAVMGIGFAIARYSATTDTEIWSGVVTGKEQNTVSCSHSYSCNCRDDCTSDSKGNQSCSQVCDTCYEHSHDYDWDVNTNIGSVITIDRIDRQGTDEPPRWTQVYAGEPVAVEHTFTNYIKANPDTVLTRFTATNPENLPVPNPPTEVYDYYRVKRFLPVAYAEPHADEWNWLLDRVNAIYGPTKQVNVIIVAVKTADQNYQYLLEHHWLGGKKNDLVILLGVPEYPKIGWVKIMSWSKSEGLKVQLRDAIQDIGTMERRDDIMKAVEQQIATNWERRHMKEFEYLMAGAQPGPGATIFLMILGTLMTAGLSWFFCVQDPFGTNDEGMDYRYRRFTNGRFNGYYSRY